MTGNIIPFKKARHMSVWASFMITAIQCKKPKSELWNKMQTGLQEFQRKKDNGKNHQKGWKFKHHLITQVISTGSLPSCHRCSKSTRQWSWSKINSSIVKMINQHYEKKKKLYLFWSKDTNFKLGIKIRDPDNWSRSAEQFWKI